MVLKRTKRLVGVLMLLLLIPLISFGCEGVAKTDPLVVFDEDGEETSKPVLFERFNITIAIPEKCLDLLLIDPVDEDETVLMSLYLKSIYEKHAGMGHLFSLIRYAESQFEQFLTIVDGGGRSFFGKDDEYYYGLFFPADVQTPENSEQFLDLQKNLSNYIKKDFITKNDIIPYSEDDFFAKPYTYDSKHVYLNYFPYFAYTGSKEIVWTLILSQPATQGEGGIWCVERWVDDSGQVHLYFPNQNGVPSRKYYQEKQRESNLEENSPWTKPEEVALKFVKRVFGHLPATLACFSEWEIPCE